MLRLVLFCCIYFVAALCEGSPSRVVQLSQGQVRGYKDVEEDIYVFYSIPYATAPTGTDKFKAPLSPPVWTETFEAVEKGIICQQANVFTEDFIDSKIMQEDCLIANIYVPETNENNLPVVVYVHGGAYVMGWGNLATPKKLVASKNIIAVTFNYRLGVHGFLCLGTKDIPGNAGMKDQVALLRWVKQNIAKFGGDPNEITIAGYSAGSSAVDLLQLSKTTDGLFKRVIPESGANTAAFSVQTNPIRNAQEFAKQLKFDNIEDIFALENFYKTISYKELNSLNSMGRTDSTFLMSPCVERDLGEERFLEDSPVNILKSGKFKKLPMLYGFANMEGLFRVDVFNTWKDRMNEKFSDFLPADLVFKDDNEKEQVAEKIKRFFFGDKQIENEDILAYIDYFTDVIFAYSTLRSVKYQVEAGNNEIYLYEYSYVTDDTPVVPYTNVRGANHCAQTMIVLDGFRFMPSPKENDLPKEMKQIQNIMREMWLNFITTGKPVVEGSNLPDWKPVGKDWSPHMSINKTLQLKGSLLKKRTEFWDSIYEEYYQLPMIPNPHIKHSEL